MGSRVYLRGDTVVEPLFNRWYATPYHVSPATSAMYVANAHVKLMQSFVASPQVHAAALKNPAMRGGPFIDHDPSRAPDVAALLATTLREQAHVIAFAEAVRTLDALLAEEARGGSLERLYPRVPAVLRGYVELCYDARDAPSVRFLEPLLYASRFYDPSRQSVRLFRARGDDRPFAFSTPRLAEPDALELPIAFADPALDALFAARHAGADFDALCASLRVAPEARQRFAGYFTDEMPAPRDDFAGPGMRVRYMGHACVLVETARTRVLVDPVFGYPHEGGVPRYSVADLPPSIDHVLITHDHLDHCLLEALLELRHRVKTVVVPRSTGGTLVDPSLRAVLRAVGFTHVVELDEMESLPIDGGQITAVPFFGEHGDLAVRTKAGYVVRADGRAVLFMADSNNVEPALYEHAQPALGAIDALFLGMECEGAPMSWMYGPLLTRPIVRKHDTERRLDGSDFAKGLEIVRRFDPRQVYIYALGQEPWLGYIASIHYTEASRPIVESDRLVAAARADGRTGERLFGRAELVLGGPGG